MRIATRRDKLPPRLLLPGSPGTRGPHLVRRLRAPNRRSGPGPDRRSQDRRPARVTAAPAARSRPRAAGELAADHEPLDFGRSVDHLQHLRQAMNRASGCHPASRRRRAPRCTRSQPAAPHRGRTASRARWRPCRRGFPAGRPPWGEPAARLEVGEHVGEREAHPRCSSSGRPNVARACVSRATSSASACRPLAIAAISNRATSIALQRRPHPLARRDERGGRVGELHLPDGQEGPSRLAIAHRECPTPGARRPPRNRDVGVAGLPSSSQTTRKTSASPASDTHALRPAMRQPSAEGRAGW